MEIAKLIEIEVDGIVSQIVRGVVIVSQIVNAMVVAVHGVVKNEVGGVTQNVTAVGIHVIETSTVIVMEVSVRSSFTRVF